MARAAGPPAVAATREVKPAGVWRRLLALLLDYVVILAWMAFLGFLSFLTHVVMGSLPDTLGTLGPLGSQVLYFFLLTFVVGVYLYRCESGPHHSTWGKRRLGLAVVGVDGAAPSRSRILVRTVVKLLPWEAAHFFVWQMMWTFYQHGYDAAPPVWIFLGLQASTAAALVYIAMVVFTGRGPHDRAAGTVVV
ncbi:RDD family protein [Pseudarthrobacter sp. SSS035]|uniref:RDD family protein n=1 Tax=Pseudarthrobacter sp. SSS035 TaxID=2931399 RepID=UPI00200F8147|nr:RDD family protein [Pseudarthrobacter sp. SSS035]